MMTASPPAIVDSHAHVWALDAYPWQPSFGIVPTAPALPADLLQQMDRCGVGHALLVQPSAYGPDHRFLFDTVRAHPDRFLPIGLVDPAVPAEVDAVPALLGAGCVGLRINLSLDLERAAAQAQAPGWAELDAAEVPICLRAVPAHLELVTAILARHPELSFVVDHLGLPEPGRPPAATAAIRQLAAFPSCMLKVAGRDRLGPHREARPIVEAALRMFGPARLVWGSDWPGSHYSNSLNLIDSMPFMTSAERHQVLADTSCKLWGVPRLERVAGA
jgi:L-fuconolactonase